MLHLKTVEEFNEVINHDKVLVDFFATWCGPCRMLGPVLEELEEETGIEIVKVDVDQFGALAQKYGIFSVPSLFLFSKGSIVKKTGGYQDINRLKNFIN